MTKARRGWLIAIVVLLVLGGLGLWISTTSAYTFLARKNVEGEVVSLADLTPSAVIGGRPSAPAGGITYSFAIVIKAKDGTIYTASSEDRQWAAVKEGYRVRATLFPYAPLDWKRQGTYHGARLRQVLSVPSSGDKAPG